MRATSFRSELEYEESSLTATLNQLVGEPLSLGARYRLSRTTASERFSTPNCCPARPRRRCTRWAASRC
ncbi:MAG: hypothetical protein M5U12_16520 [Verrucomicrobia bacterium]|nr:hypothetical protein [Verrucomicrobiota bacterium]